MANGMKKIANSINEEFHPGKVEQFQINELINKQDKKYLIPNNNWDKSLSNLNKNLYCEICDYTERENYDYNIHLKSIKHAKNIKKENGEKTNIFVKLKDVVTILTIKGILINID